MCVNTRYTVDARAMLLPVSLLPSAFIPLLLPPSPPPSLLCSSPLPPPGLPSNAMAEPAAL